MNPLVNAYLLSEVGPGFHLSENFVLVEFASRDGYDLVLVAPALLEVCQDIRTKTEAPLRINSGFRSLTHNRNVKGKPHSRHLLGWAGDLDSMTVKPRDLALQLHARFPSSCGIGSYASFTHFDVRPGPPVRWIDGGPPVPVEEWIHRVASLSTSTP